MRREFKDDLVATLVLALCTVVLLLPARAREGSVEIRLAAPGSPIRTANPGTVTTPGVVTPPASEAGAVPETSPASEIRPTSKKSSTPASAKQRSLRPEKTGSPAREDS